MGTVNWGHGRCADSLIPARASTVIFWALAEIQKTDEFLVYPLLRDQATPRTFEIVRRLHGGMLEWAHEDKNPRLVDPEEIRSGEESNFAVNEALEFRRNC